MENFIDHINISNFKSIRNLNLEGLTRINLFIGKPNVGKSNILEALGVFSLPYLKNNSNKISNIVRAENKAELFFDGLINNDIKIETNIGKYVGTVTEKLIPEKITWNPNLLFIIQILSSTYTLNFDQNLKFTIRSENYVPPKIKYYNFKTEVKGKRSNVSFLLPPSGDNILSTIEFYPELKNEIKNLFNEYNLELVFDRASQELKIIKPSKHGEIFLIPYNSIADTLQRIIFYKTAIGSNQNSVLIFEEPEAHAFPPYISHITHEIIDSKSNQFILSTHSPYVLNDFLENARDELSIFMVDYKEGETVANKLTKENLDDIYGYGIDLFTNYETFLL
jgi:AAA15 family ATPase/GTPase